MGKILVADAYFGVRKLLFEALLEDQHDVQIAVNGDEALLLFLVFKPDLILIDMKIPGINGIEVLEQIRVLDRRVAVIMMMDNMDIIDIQDIEHSQDLGIHYYIAKPFDLFELKTQVREALNRSRVITEEL